jgi:hypothetical protein
MSNAMKTKSTTPGNQGTIIAITAVLAFAATTVLAGKPGGGSGGPTPVCIQFRDQAGDRIQSDGSGPYRNGDPDIAADIPVDGPAELNTDASRKVSGGRTLFMDFSNGLLLGDDTILDPPSQPDPNNDPWSGYTDKIYLRTRHFRNEQNVNVYLPIFDVPKGESRAHGLYINFWTGGEKWVLTYGNIEFQTDPYATLVLITRLTDKAQGDACNSWLIEAPSTPTAAVDADGTPRTVYDIAKLKKTDSKGSLSGQPSRGKIKGRVFNKQIRLP